MMLMRCEKSWPLDRRKSSANRQPRPTIRERSKWRTATCFAQDTSSAAEDGRGVLDEPGRRPGWLGQQAICPAAQVQSGVSRIVRLKTTMNSDFLVCAYSEDSHRHAILADDGLTGILYLHAPSDDPARTAEVEATCFAYNRIEPIEVKDVHTYRPAPPP